MVLLLRLSLLLLLLQEHSVQAPGGSSQLADRLVKAKSDGSISSSMTATDTSAVMSRLKSRSLEPLTGLAMWSEEVATLLLAILLPLQVITIELQKTERGLGFSILDYQDPLLPTESVIVIRSLVPGGVAQQDGRLIPGDRSATKPCSPSSHPLQHSLLIPLHLLLRLLILLLPLQAHVRK